MRIAPTRREPSTTPLRLAMSLGTPTTSIAPYRYPAEGAEFKFAVTTVSAPGWSVNFVWLTLTPGSVPRRFGDTLPVTACTHGRGATVTSSAVVERLATVIDASWPGWALCSIRAGETDSPPSFVWAADPPAAAPCTAAAPAAPSAVSTAPSATYRFMLPSPCLSVRGA